METKEEIHERIAEVVQFAPVHFNSSEDLRTALEESIPESIVEIARFESDFISGSVAYRLAGDRISDDGSSPRVRVIQFESDESWWHYSK